MKFYLNKSAFDKYVIKQKWEFSSSTELKNILGYNKFVK